jgi:hypothetical protein
MTQIALWGYVDGEDTVFFVEIEDTVTIAQLKKVIKKEKAYLDADTLILYKLGNAQGISRTQLKVRRWLSSRSSFFR